MGNVIRDGDAAIQLRGSSVECYVERSVDERTMGATALGRGPVFWTGFRNNRVRGHEEATVAVGQFNAIDGCLFHDSPVAVHLVRTRPATWCARTSTTAWTKPSSTKAPTTSPRPEERL